MIMEISYSSARGSHEDYHMEVVGFEPETLVLSLDDGSGASTGR